MKILSFFAVFSLLLSTAQAAPVVVERLEASVNSSLILLSDVTKFRQTLKLRAQLDPLFNGTAIASKGTNATTAEIVDFLIDEHLITQAFPATDAEVEQEINLIQANNHIDRAGLKSALQEQGFAFEDYFELIRASVSKKNLIDRDIRTKVTISEDDVKNYYYNHYAKSNSNRAYHLQLISVSLSSYKTANAAHDVAQKAVDALKNGEAFSEVARRFSDDPNATNGGELGTMTEDQISPLIREQLKGLQIGQTSPVFGGQGNGAFLIIKLADVRADDEGQLARMKDEIMQQLTSAEYQRQLQLWIERERQNAFIHSAGQPTVTSGKPSS